MIMLIKPNFRTFCTRSALYCSELLQTRCWNRVNFTNLHQTQVPILYQFNSQIKELVRNCRLIDARKLFDELPQRDEVTWTNLISGYVNKSDYSEALRLFYRMWVDNSIRVDHFVVSIALKACGLDDNLSFGKLIHGVVVKIGLYNSVYVGSALLDMYAKAGDISESCRVFDAMPERNIVSWTAIITGLVNSGKCKEALMYFSSMWGSGLQCDSYCFASSLKACSDIYDLEHGKQIHTQAIKMGFDEASYVVNTLATMYNRCGKFDYGMCLFGRIRVPDVVGCTSLITSYFQMGKEDVAVQLFMRLRNSDVRPNEYTFAAVITACAHLGKIDWAEQLHADVEKSGFMDDLSVANSVMTLYSKCGLLKSASSVFSSMTGKDIVSWSSIIAGYSQAGYGDEAFEYFSWMRREGPEPNEFALASVLSVSGSMAILDQGRQLHAYILKIGLDHTSQVHSALINMYSKCGSIRDASEVFNRTKNDDVVCWTSMVNGFAEHGHSQEAIDLFEKMLQVGLRPDTVTFIGVLSACNHAGLVDLGHRYFDSMIEKFQIHPSKEHYGCMIDLLCRAGKLIEAENMIKSMPSEGDDVVWSILLRACRDHGDIERAKHAAEMLLKFNPNCATTLTTLANIYSSKGKWREAADIRKLMRSKGVMKETGSSWIKLQYELTAFASGDKTHPKADDIYNVLALLTSGVDKSAQDVDTLLLAA